MKINYFDQKTETWRTVFVKDTDPRAKQVLAIFDGAPIESNPLILTGKLLKMLWKWLAKILKQVRRGAANSAASLVCS